MSMQRKSFEKMACPIARGLERVGEWWSMLIMRDALYGMRRFDEFQKSLGIAAEHANAVARCAGRGRSA
jgi:DNA-binding HxlR family transcriptional regulator